MNLRPIDVIEAGRLGLLEGSQNPELWGTNWLSELLLAAGAATAAAGAPPIQVRYASQCAGGETAILKDIFDDHSRLQRLGAPFDGGMHVAIDLPTSENQVGESFFRTRPLNDGNTYIAAKTAADPNGDNHVAMRATGSWHTRDATSNEFTVTTDSSTWLPRLALNVTQGLPAYAVTTDSRGHQIVSRVTAVNVGQLRITLADSAKILATATAPFTIAFAQPISATPDTNSQVPYWTLDESALLALSALFVDNPDMNGSVGDVLPYRGQDVIDQMLRFQYALTASGAEVSEFYFNDPRLWSGQDVSVVYHEGNFGQFTVAVAPPVTTEKIAAETKAAMLTSLSTVSNFLSEIENQPALGQTVPGMGTTKLSDAVNPASSFTSGIVAPLSSYLNQSSDPDVDGLLGALQSGIGPDSTVDTGFRHEGSLLLFDISFRDQTTFATMPLGLDIGLSALNVGASLNIDVKGELAIDFTIGIDTAQFGNPSEAFFIQVRQFSASAFVQTYDLNAALNLGFLDAAIKNGKVVLDATLSALVTDPNLDGRITLAEMANHPFSDMFELSLSSKLDVDLPFFASVGGFSTSTTNPPRLLVTDNDLFSDPAPNVTLQDFDQILGFSSFDSDSVLAILRSLAERVRGMGQSAAFNFELPFTHKRLGDAVDLGLDFVDTLESITGDPTSPAHSRWPHGLPRRWVSISRSSILSSIRFHTS